MPKVTWPAYPLGPFVTVHAPVPDAIELLLPTRLALAVAPLHTDCPVPAVILAVLGGVTTVAVVVVVELGEHGEFDIVHVIVYAPAGAVASAARVVVAADGVPNVT